MFNLRIFSTKHNFKTGFLSKLLIILGIILIFISGSMYVLKLITKQFIIPQKTIESIFAFSIIFIAIGIILHFLYLQFIKLDEIARDIEENSEYCE